jgi:hypothetical protein
MTGNELIGTHNVGRVHEARKVVNDGREGEIKVDRWGDSV